MPMPMRGSHSSAGACHISAGLQSCGLPVSRVAIWTCPKLSLDLLQPPPRDRHRTLYPPLPVACLALFVCCVSPRLCVATTMCRHHHVSPRPCVGTTVGTTVSPRSSRHHARVCVGDTHTHTHTHTHLCRLSPPCRSTLTSPRPHHRSAST